MSLVRHSLYLPKTFISLLYLWSIYLLKNVLRGHRRYIALSPHFMKTQYIWDRKYKSIFSVRIRDGVDWTQLEHIFLCEEYNLEKTQRLGDILDAYNNILSSSKKPLIIDCGANIGFASHYLSTTFSHATVVAIEPDPLNYSVAIENCKSLDVDILNAAVSCEAGKGSLIDMGSSNAFRVVRDDASDLSFVTIDSILADKNNCTPFIIKVDIEGFEKDLFSKNTEWIDKFPVLIIELHDWMLPRTGTSQNFMREIANRNRDFMHYDGYVVSISNDI